MPVSATSLALSTMAPAKVATDWSWIALNAAEIVPVLVMPPPALLSPKTLTRVTSTLMPPMMTPLSKMFPPLRKAPLMTEIAVVLPLNLVGIWPLEWHLAPRDISGRRSTARRQVNPERPWDELDRSHHPCPGTFVLLLLIKPM